MRMLLAACLALVGGLLPLAPASAQEQDDPISELPWQYGPTTGQIGNRASIKVPEGYAFLDASGARQLNELMENPQTSYDEYVIAPEHLDWIAYFSFDEIGYVKDDEKLDAGDVLDSIRSGTEHGNQERSSRGWETLHVVGWSFKPQYDQQLNALEWAVLLEARPSESKVVNYNTRFLGRRGVMEVTLATDPDELDPAIADFKRLMPGYEFAQGEKYSEFRPGDHVAEIGLAALITGGAAALASKKGWFAALGVALAKFWKLILLGLVAVGVAVRKLFKRKDDSGAS